MRTFHKIGLRENYFYTDCIIISNIKKFLDSLELCKIRMYVILHFHPATKIPPTQCQGMTGYL